MTGGRSYPDEPSDPFPTPPITFADGQEREIEIRRFDGDRDPLVAMYVGFDPEDRAQGIPPAGEERIRDWLDAIVPDGPDVLAWHGDEVAGHATLVPDGDGAYELAIFVTRAYQGAGIGTQLIQGLLGAGRADGIERVWLTVERWNHAAIGLYRNVGFETADTESFELEMTIRLSTDSDPER